MTKEEIRAQIVDLKKIKHDWEEGGDNKSPYPNDDLIAELEAQVKSRRKVAEDEDEE